jgi:hypothetical protein
MEPRQTWPRRRRASLAVVAGLAAAILVPTEAFAYSPSAAAFWADGHWNSCGVAGQYPCIDNDCTNFASQTIHAGGVDFKGFPGGNVQDGHNWYAAFPSGHYVYTNTWVFVENLYDFLIWDVPGGVLAKTWTGSQTLPPDSQGGTGDLIFYDWNPNAPDGGSEPRDHVNPIVAYGTSTDTNPQPPFQHYQGDLIDGHSSYRYHYFWGLQSVNQFRLTTVFYVMHILSTN